MKASNLVNSLFGWFAIAGLGLSAIIVFGGCNGGGGSDTTTISKTGTLGVGLGYGAVTESGYPCKGSGTVTVSPSAGGTQPPPQSYAITGISNSTSPACSTNVTFTNLQPGLWHIQDSGGSNCQKQVTAGAHTTVTIRTDVGTCQ